MSRKRPQPNDTVLNKPPNPTMQIRILRDGFGRWYLSFMHVNERIGLSGIWSWPELEILDVALRDNGLVRLEDFTVVVDCGEGREGMEEGERNDHHN